MRPEIKKSIIEVIKANLVHQPARDTYESIEYKENAQPQVATPTPAPEQSKARGIKSAIRKILGKKKAKPEATKKKGYTCITYLTLRQFPEPSDNSTIYTLLYNGSVFEQRVIYQEQTTLTPAQQDIIDIRDAFVKQYDAQLQNGYGPKMSAREMAMSKYLNSLQK